MNTSHQSGRQAEIEGLDSVLETLAALISIPIREPEEIRQLHTLRDLLDTLSTSTRKFQLYKQCCHTILCKAISQANVAERIRTAGKPGSGKIGEASP
jgi:hypothetical protein